MNDDSVILGWNEHNDHAGDEQDSDQVYMTRAIEAFVAAMEGDRDSVRAQIADLTSTERKALRMDLKWLQGLLDDTETAPPDSPLTGSS